jgi:hypothetical protein
MTSQGDILVWYVWRALPIRGGHADMAPIARDWRGAIGQTVQSATRTCAVAYI